MVTARDRLDRRGVDGDSTLRRFLIGLAVAALLAGCTFQRQVTEEGEGEALPQSAPEAVEAMLVASAASWNAGDLDGFMDDYWRSGNLSFSGSGGVTRGWENVRDRYLRSYWAPGAQRDSLRFEDIEVTPLGEEYALALGRYVLYRVDGEGNSVEAGTDSMAATDSPRETVTSSGFFSLIFRRMEGHWKIIHDHTSAMAEGEEEPEGGG